MKKQIFLASRSPRRRELLSGLGITFMVKVAAVNENKIMEELVGEQPAKLAEILSYKKAVAVTENVTNGLIIGADTIVVLDDQILGKPTNKEDAKRMLFMFSGREHQVVTGITVIDAESGKALTRHVVTDVCFRDLTESMIDNYLQVANYHDKAGAYAIQEHAALFVKQIRGCYFNVVGLPLYTLADMMADFEVNWLG